MVSMVSKQSANPKADRMDRQSCSWVAERIIQVSIKNGFRTQADWDRYFSMNDAIEKGNIGEWALQSIINENGDNGDTENDVTNTPTDTDNDATSKIHRTAGKKKIQERPLIDYLDCNNKEEVLRHIRKYISINTSAVHQALPFYVLKDLRLVAGMHTAKEYSVGLALQFPDLPSLKSESAIRQSVGFLKAAKYVIKEGKDQLAPLIESDENQELYQNWFRQSQILQSVIQQILAQIRSDAAVLDCHIDLYCRDNLRQDILYQSLLIPIYFCTVNPFPRFGGASLL